MTKKSHTQRNWQELYYDGEVDCFDERDVSPEMKQGIDDCIKYIEEESEFDILWYKHEAQKKYYRKPYNPKELLKYKININK